MSCEGAGGLWSCSGDVSLAFFLLSAVQACSYIPWMVRNTININCNSPEELETTNATESGYAVRVVRSVLT